MHRDSLWLGPAKKLFRNAAVVFGTLTALIYAYLIFGQFAFDDPIGMHEMIRPTGRPIVAAMLLCILGTFLCSSIYFSDTKGAIEAEPHGFFDVLSLVASRMAMIMTAFIVVVMFYEVVSRYVFASPTLWANELSLWLAAFVFLFAGQYAMQQRSHIRIYVIYDVMPRWAQKTSDIISTVLIVFFAFAMIWGGYNDAATRFMRMETFGTAWDPPIPGVVKPAILFIIALVAVQAVSNLISDWNKTPEHIGHDDIDEVDIENIRKTLER